MLQTRHNHSHDEEELKYVSVNDSVSSSRPVDLSLSADHYRVPRAGKSVYPHSSQQNAFSSFRCSGSVTMCSQLISASPSFFRLPPYRQTARARESRLEYFASWQIIDPRTRIMFNVVLRKDGQRVLTTHSSSFTQSLCMRTSSYMCKCR